MLPLSLYERSPASLIAGASIATMSRLPLKREVVFDDVLQNQTEVINLSILQIGGVKSIAAYLKLVQIKRWLRCVGVSAMVWL